MKVTEYLQEVAESQSDITKISCAENIYGTISSELAKKIISSAEQANFFDDDNRSLSFDEIMNAGEYLHVDFIGRSLLPLFDSGDNNFIVYQINNNTWAEFNITDEIIFRVRASLKDLLIVRR